MPKVNSLVCLLSLVGVSAYAQTDGTTTLNQAIETAKQRKAAELNFNASAYARPQTGATASSTSKGQVAKPIPKLWSIQGVGHALKAEVMYQGLIYEISFENDAIRVGDWLLESLSAKELVLVQPKYFGKTEVSARREIRLQVPSTTQTVQIFPVTATTGIESVSAQGDALPGNAATAGRPPVPFELLRQ
jgi:hypothetical protein